jgi:hypothetical protein
MENLNEGKNKKPNYMTELAEIDAQSAIVAMEAKINKLEEMAATKEQRLSMVSEDENLSELISKSAVKEMQKEIKEIRKMQEKLKKVYEKKNGKTKEVVKDEAMEEMVDPTSMDPSDLDKAFHGKDKVERDPMTGNIKEDELDEAHCTSEEDNTDPVNEEFLRMQKLAGVLSEEEMNEKLLGLMSDVSTGGKLGIGTDKGGLIFTKLGKGRYKLTNPTNHPSFREGEVWKPRQDEKTLKVGQSFPRLGDIEGLRVDGESKQKVRT